MTHGALGLAVGIVLVTWCLGCVFGQGLSGPAQPPGTHPGPAEPEHQFFAIFYPLTANFSESSSFNGTCTPFTETVYLTGNATGGTPPYQFLWYFGSGSPAQSGQTTNHTYDSAGYHTVTLHVTDSVGSAASATKVIFVPVPTGCPPGTIIPYASLPPGPLDSTPLIASFAAFTVLAVGIVVSIIRSRRPSA